MPGIPGNSQVSGCCGKVGGLGWFCGSSGSGWSSTSSVRRLVLNANPAWQVYQRDRYPLPDSGAFMEEMRQPEHHFITLARSRAEEETARRKAVEAVLLNHEYWK
jgi:hypothetical protein